MSCWLYTLFAWRLPLPHPYFFELFWILVVFVSWVVDVAVGFGGCQGSLGWPVLFIVFFVSPYLGPFVSS